MSRFGGEAPQPAHILDGSRTGHGRLRAFHQEMLAEELAVVIMLVEMLRRQHGRNDRDLGIELDAHQRADHRVGHEFVPVDAAVDDEAGGDHGGIAPGFGKNLRMERNLERTRDLEEIDKRLGDSLFRQLGDEGRPALIDDVPVPAGLDERDPLPRAATLILARAGFGWTDSWQTLSQQDQNQGARATPGEAQALRRTDGSRSLSSGL